MKNWFRPQVEPLENRCTPSAQWFNIGPQLFYVNTDNQAHVAGAVSDGHGGYLALLDQNPPQFFSGINTVEFVSDAGAADNLSFLQSGPRQQTEYLIFVVGGPVNTTVDDRQGTLSGDFFCANYRLFCSGNATYVGGSVAKGSTEIIQDLSYFGSGATTFTRTGTIDGFAADECYTVNASITFNANFTGSVNGYLAEYYFGGSNTGPASMSIDLKGGTGDTDGVLRGNYNANSGSKLYMNLLDESGGGVTYTYDVVINANDIGNVTTAGNGVIGILNY
jgi:hypothetical protein